MPVLPAGGAPARIAEGMASVRAPPGARAARGGRERRVVVVDGGDRDRAGGAGEQAKGVGEPAAEMAGQRRQPEREGEADGGVHREAVARPRDALVVLGRARRAAEDVARDRDAEVEPHAEEDEPGED